MSDECAQCNKIRVLSWGPTRRDMTADHTMERVCQAKPPAVWVCSCGDRETADYCANCGNPKPKPPESEALAALEELIRYLDTSMELQGCKRRIDAIRTAIEADAQRLKEAERERDGAQYNEGCVMADLAAVKGRLAKLIEGARVVARLYNLPGLLNACDEAEAGEQREHVHAWRPRPIGEWVCDGCGNHRTTDPWLANQKLEEVIADRAKWIKVCDERDNRIVELCNLMRRIKAYAGQHTQYPFANAIIDLCNQVLELR